jgi:class 3 adenylate cyclase/predicted ATPase
MTFEEILDHATAMLQRRGRVSYRTLKLQFELDEEALEALKEELIEVHHLAVDHNGRMLVWAGEASATAGALPLRPFHEAIPQDDASPLESSAAAVPPSPDAERRQLTVMFCDLVGSTALSRQHDPEELREIIRLYQATCAEIIQHFEGYIAQYLGDGLLVYFGYPQAHEDDAQRAVRTGLGVLATLGDLNARLAQRYQIRIAVRIGIHTGLVVVGEMGGGGRQEQLALGETPNLAARLEGLAAPNTVVISDRTHRLVQGYFTCDDFGFHSLKGVETPIQVYRVVRESAAQSRLDVAGAIGLTPLVGREHEVRLLQERWAQSQAGQGQVVLLSGEAGIGKSRLVHVLTERVVDEGALRLTLRCSPYHTASAFYPIIEHLQRLLQWQRHATPEARLTTLEQALQAAGLPLVEVVPLVAALLAVPLPEQYPPLTLSPQRQKQKTHEALVAWLLAEAVQQPVLAVWEDLHWADPSTLELLGLLLDHVPTARLLLVLTCRPEFHPPWAAQSSVTPLTLTHLTRPQIEAMVLRMTGGKPLPAEVLAQVVVKTDGIPLFVEELVKTILESVLMQDETDRYVLTGPLPPLAIPATLQDALMARLDRVGEVKAVAQLGAVLGREFSYALLRAVAPLTETDLPQALDRVVSAELLYQHGFPPQATYTFKHALIQDAAYHSLLRSTRQQHHQRIAQVLVAQFPETAAAQPELVAQHYTEAGLGDQALPYWHQAGQRSAARCAYIEAVRHFRQGLAVLAPLPETPERRQRELALQLGLGPALMVTQGFGVPEVRRTYDRARALCQDLEDSPQLVPVLLGLYTFYRWRADYRTARELAEHALQLAQQRADPVTRLRAHHALAFVMSFQGDLAAARPHFEHALALYTAQPHPVQNDVGVDYGVQIPSILAWLMEVLGYPDQALRWNQEALTRAREQAHAYTLVEALIHSAYLHQFRREAPATQAHAAAAITLATEQGVPGWEATGTVLHGWALVAQGHSAQGLAQMQQGLSALQAIGIEVGRPYFLAHLAAAYGMRGQPEVGLQVLAEASATARTTGEAIFESERYRLRGELVLEQAVPDTHAAETYFQQARAMARHQHATLLELRAAMSLSRLWQRHGKRVEARELLAPVYGWFTEGFDTADLQEAKSLLDTLA